MRTIFCVKLSINNHIVRLVHKNYIIRTCLMYHAACKVEFPVCVSSELLRDGREGRTPMAWHSRCDNERTIIALRTNALRAYEGKSSELIPPGPRSRVGTIQLNWVSSAQRELLAFRRPESPVLLVLVWDTSESNGRFCSSWMSTDAGRWRSPSYKLVWRPSR